MVTADTLGDALTHWAAADRTVHALVLIGSRARSDGDPRLAADAFSDWDYHVITSNPEAILRGDWVRAANLPAPSVYVARRGRLGAAMKVTAVFSGTLVDFVVIPASRMRLLRVLLATGLARRMPGIWHALRGLAVVLAHGHRVVKGGSAWVQLYDRIAREVPGPRLTDEDVCLLADSFVCDYLSTRHKIARGEFIAAQRWLHQHLAEVNFQLLHELRLRQGARSMPDARRIETLAGAELAGGVRIAAQPTAASLLEAAEGAARTLRQLMADLVGDRWRWPEAITPAPRTIRQ